MKKYILIALVLLASALLGTLFGTVHYTDVNIRAPFVHQYSSRVAHIDLENDVNDITIPLNWITGYIEGITIKPGTGTDAVFQVDVNDENGASIFSKSTFDSGNGTVRLAISHSDTGGTDFVGVPVNGQCSVSVRDANTTSLANLEIFIYYRECRRE